MSDVKKGVSLGILVLVAGGLMALAAEAGQETPNCPVAFADFDVDGSGLISEDEFNTVRGQRMAEKAAQGKQMKGAATAPAFVDIDTDGDGQLNADELDAAQKAHMEKSHEVAKDHGRGHGHGKGEGMGKMAGKDQ